MNHIEHDKYKTDLTKGYDAMADQYGTQRNERFDTFLEARLVHFKDSVTQIGDRVIDIGSASGHESARFRDMGLYPVCIDLSPQMIDKCREKGLEAHIMDYYTLAFPDQSFDGAWMSHSLLHAPKQDVPAILAGIHRVLAPGGILYVSLFEGTGEGPRKEDIRRFGVARYFSYYTEEEFRALLEPSFEVTDYQRLDISPRPTLSFECRSVLGKSETNERR